MEGAEIGECEGGGEEEGERQPIRAQASKDLRGGAGGGELCSILGHGRGGRWGQTEDRRKQGQ